MKNMFRRPAEVNIHDGYLAKLAEKYGCAVDDVIRVVRVCDEYLEGWATSLLSLTWRQNGPSWLEHRTAHRDFVIEIIEEKLHPAMVRMIQVTPDIKHEDLCIRACCVFRVARTKNLLQKYYSSISSPGNWNVGMSGSGECYYKNTEKEIRMGEMESAFTMGDEAPDYTRMDPADIVEREEELQVQRTQVNLWLEKIRAICTPRQYNFASMVLRDGMTIEQVAEATNETVRNVTRCLDRMRPMLSNVGDTVRAQFAYGDD